MYFMRSSERIVAGHRMRDTMRPKFTKSRLSEASIVVRSRKYLIDTVGDHEAMRIAKVSISANSLRVIFRYRTGG